MEANQNKVLFLSNLQYDIYSIRKVIALNTHLGKIGVHDADGGYLLSFSHCENGAEWAAGEFQKLLDDLTQNIWSH